MKKIFHKDMLYKVLRVLIGILFVLNVVGIFLVDDHSQRSRLAFNAFQSLLFIIASLIPGFIEKRGNLEIPDFMEIIFIIMCVCHFVLGEMMDFFIKYSWWDSMLHTFSGSMIAILGFSLINSINNYNKNMNIPAILVAIFAVCFSVTLGVLWEIIEFIVDGLTKSNMQRYMHNITHDPFLGRKALMDTMKDLILDTVGACVVAVIGYLDIKHKNSAFNSWTIRKNEEKAS